MTVSTQVSRNEYTGNGATTQYDFTFRILDKSHLLVQTLDTSESIVTLTLGTDYTVTGVNRYNGGKVVLRSALPAGYKISIERSTPVTQEASIRNQGGFFPEIHEDAFDKLTMLVQQAYGWWSGLSLRKPSWLANYYDALNNRIRNLRDPSQAQDAATKHYVDDQINNTNSAWQEGDRVLDQKIDSNFRRSLRVPDSYVEALPLLSQLEGKILAFSGGRPIGVLPESGSAADVMIELADDDGYRHVGECSSISELRAVTLDYHGQKVKLRCWDMSQTTALIDVFYVYDATDTTSVDDGYRTIVNSAGQRFKAVLNGGINLKIAGLRDSGDNVGTAFNRVYNAEIARVIASRYALKMPTIVLPELNAFGDPGSGDEYNSKLNASIKIPSFVPIKVEGNYTCKFEPTKDHAIWVTNEIDGIVPGLTQWRNMQTVKMFRNDSARFRLFGPGGSTSNAAGFKIGNTKSGDDILDVRDLRVEDLTLKGFRYGLDFDWHDTYILKFIGFELSSNYWNICSRLPAKENAGENILLADGLFSGALSHCFYWNAPGIGLVCENSSIDYNNGSVIFMANGGRGNSHKFVKCHIEGWGSMLVHQEAQAVAWYNQPNRITFDNECEIKAAGNMPGVWASRRKILHSGAVLNKLGTEVYIYCPIYWPAPASEPHIALMGYTDTTPQYMEARYECPSSPYPDCLVSYRQSDNKGLYRFNTAGTGSILATPANPTLADATCGYSFTSNGNPTVEYGEVDSDGFMHIVVIFDAESSWLEISNKGLYYSLGRGAEINTGISVMMEAINSGTLTLNTRFRYFYGASKTPDGYEDGTTVNLTALLTATYNGNPTPLTTNAYVGEQSSKIYTRQDSAHPTQAEYVQPGIVLRGVTGKIRLKLPVIWHTRGKGQCVVE
ncbi:phage tail fiber domain-containing protein [Klebsiella quasipneumoniae]|uniref:phage tail fiber domain-containing protein n=1 Tax=Klebsiella quasipneumoniae TaxID=1463165 RepID=UPI0029D7EA06|nr:phage tail fiber protein [Klebsiella quasipneumoniae]MDX7656126.1 phage tail fiber protein [Klebsiella quasipneumoniae]